MRAQAVLPNRLMNTPRKPFTGPEPGRPAHFSAEKCFELSKGRTLPSSVSLYRNNWCRFSFPLEIRSDTDYPWQGRLRSPVIQGGDHLLVVLRYIEANPVRAAMVADPCESTWSSHRCHGAGHADPILDSFPEWEQFGRTEPERRARWRRKVRGEQPGQGVGWRTVVGAQWPALRCRGLGRGHFPSPRHRP